MAKAIAKLQGLRQKMSGKEQESKPLQVNMQPPRLVDIEFNNITLTVSEGITSKKKKTILKGVSGLFRSGQLTAIMGPSGAGKSSLMNALTGFSTRGITGSIRAGDGVSYKLSTNSNMQRSLKYYRRMSCYILQDDRLNPLFTVKELMKFAADMKLGNTLTDKIKMSVITDIMLTLGLTETENTRCCNLSGGQRKRLSIAVELIDNPPVLFLDEPTTGLDSKTSAQCIEMLKNLARNGRTIVCTIHQPPASIYSLFDQVYILAEGLCIYQGASENTVPYLASVGLHCPIYHNPADYIMEIATGEYGNFNELLAEKCSNDEVFVKTVTHTAEIKDTMSLGKTSVLMSTPNELYKFCKLCKRCLLHQYRDWTISFLRIGLHAVIGILLGLLFQNAGSDASKTFSNLGFLLVSTVYLCYTSLMPAVLKIPSEMLVLKKENFNNWYNLKTYYAALLITGMPLQVLYSFMYSVPSYFISGQPHEAFRFVMFAITLANVALLAEAIGHVLGSCFNPVNGTFLGAIWTCAMLVYAGYLVTFAHMSPFMRMVSYGSFLRHAFEALVLALYSNGRGNLTCPADVVYCHVKYPSQIITQLSMQPNNFWLDTLILILEIIVIRILAYFTLKRNVKKSA